MADITGTAGADSLTSTPDADDIHGEAGDDTIHGDFYREYDTIWGGDGNDNITSFLGVAYGGLGNDTIIGRAMFDVRDLVVVDGGPGDDMLDAGPSSWPYGYSFTALLYVDATSGVTVSLGETGPQSIGGGMGVDTIAHFKNVIGSAYDDVLDGGSLFESGLYGGLGNDVLRNADLMDGGPGDDLFYNGTVAFGRQPLIGIIPDFPPLTGGVTVDLRITGPQDVGGGMGRDTFIGVHKLYGSDYGDVFTGDDDWNILFSGAGNDTLHGNGGNDDLVGFQGDDLVFGDAGDDRIEGTEGSNYLRGGEGNDLILGGWGFDDANGNMGNDTIQGGAGDDWVVGGKDDDRLYGEWGLDIVYGNLGADTCDGGVQNDLVRGGQGNDILDGGSGDDWLSGDRGDDTITGGDGADIFHGSQDAGIDRITDFHSDQGDRIQLDAGTTFTLKDVSGIAVLDFGGGHQMILAGVPVSTFTGTWVFWV
jgi:Ca2+-binding RTX toxin-like protein